MATLKIKFRPSVQGGGLGTIYYQIIYNRIARQKQYIRQRHVYTSHHWIRWLLIRRTI